MPSRNLGHRAPLLWIVLPLMAGLIAGRAELPLGAVRFQLACALGVSALALWAAWRERPVWGASVVVAMFLAGAASYTLHRARLRVWDALPPREARLTLQIERTFPRSDQRSVSGLAIVRDAEEHLRDLSGQPLYFSLQLPKGAAVPLRSAVVSAVGLLITLPPNAPPNTFDGYLASAGMNFKFTRGRITAEVRPATPYQRFCAQGARLFTRWLGLGVEAKQPELTGVFRAMLLGQKQEMNDEQGTLFMRSGTMHLFAISGLHITVIAVALHALLGLMRLPYIIRFFAELAALWLYVDITGAAPSAVRAFIMVALVEASFALRAPRNPIAALTASALVVLLAWPLQLFSASFQLSYAIVAALLLMGLPLADRWQSGWGFGADRPRPAWAWHHRAFGWLQRELFSAVAIGMASTLISTLGGILFFQLFTPGALFANLILIPSSLLVILGGFASLMAGLIGADSLCALFNHAALVVLWLIDGAVRRIVEVPGTWHAARFAADWIGPASVLLLLAALIVGYLGAWRHTFGGWWPPFVVVGLTLLMGVKWG